MWSAFLTAILVASQANALLRFHCAQTTITRSDPLVDPGRVSGHVHQVVGGNKFDFSMPNTGDNMQSATCTSCGVRDNKSNYWTPNLYFQSPRNGTFRRVNQKPGPLLSGHGGMTVYYIQVGTVTAFPKNFRMLAGDPFLRSYDSNIADSRSIRFRCLNSEGSTEGPETTGMPTGNCAGGIRTQINFPTCWDGRNLDSTNHKTHVAYANGASFGDFGSGCPSTHPVTIPLLFIETIWDTNVFRNEWQGGKSPFVWSMGDPTGYGYHADYMMGWPEQLLKDAMAQCNDFAGDVSGCSVLRSVPEQDMNDCAIPNRVAEEIDGWLTALPGCNAIQAGPGRATPQTGCGAPTGMLPQNSVSFLKSGISGWEPVGCASETSNENLLGGSRTTGGMSIERCINICANSNSKYAGLKNGNQCSCGNNINTSKFNSNYACNLHCDGDATGYCGAANRIAVYSGSGTVTLPSTSAQPTTYSPPGPTTTTGGGGGGGGTVPKYGQCGGKDWTGGTVCAAGSTCKFSNDWYSQCL